MIPSQIFDMKVEEKYKEKKVVEIIEKEEKNKKEKILEDFLYLNIIKGKKTLLIGKILKKEIIENSKKKTFNMRDGIYSFLSYYKKKELERVKTELLKNVSSFRTI